MNELQKQNKKVDRLAALVTELTFVIRNAEKIFEEEKEILEELKKI